MWRRVRLGADVQLVRETADGVDLQGPLRLRPGQRVSITPAAGRDSDGSRRAWVLTWTVVQTGSSGLTYRGHCRWETVEGN